jgi:antitoxin (DNA-binding transcriptional repressor) of toxin-antitoxin stability system
MRTANIGVLKNQLSAYLRYVRNGEEVVICDRNVPIAKMVPMESPYPTHGVGPLKETLTDEDAELVATGRMKLAEKEMDWDAFWALPRPTVSDEAVREAIEWAKGDR